MNTQEARDGSTARRTIPIHRKEIEQYLEMQKSGFGIRDSIKVSFERADDILFTLENGESFRDVLSRGLKGRSGKLLHCLLDTFDFNTAVSILHENENTSQTLEKMILSQAAYPLFLMVFSYVILCFFIQSILPAMAMYQDTSSSILYVLFFLFTLIWFILAGFVGVYVWVFYLRCPLKFLEKAIYAIPVVQLIHTYQFSVMVMALHENGLSTMQSLEVMHNLTSLPFVQSTAGRWNRKIFKGTSLSQCIQEDTRLDPVWKTFFFIGMEARKLPVMLETYQKNCHEKIRKEIKIVSLYIQIFSYSCVGILVLSVYQIMLSPLNMLSAM